MKYIEAEHLKAEIERRIEILKKAELDWAKQGDTETSVYYSGKSVALDEFNDFIDSLQQEQLSLPDNLDEAADAYYSKNYCDVDDGPSVGMARDAFKAGAQWMKDQLTVK